MSVAVFADNLPTHLTQRELEQFFAPFHPLRVILATHRSGRCLGFGFVLFASREAADQARRLDGASLKGSVIRLSDGLLPEERVEVA